MKTNPARGSHLPVLMKLLRVTDGTVLELGSGMYSTAFLHWACWPKRKLITYENQREWIGFANQFKRDYHEIVFVEDWGKITFPEAKIALVDYDTPGRFRAEEVGRLTNVDFVVCHDSENRSDKKYKYSTINDKFKYRFKFTEAGLPYTTIYSNVCDYQSL